MIARKGVGRVQALVFGIVDQYLPGHMSDVVANAPGGAKLACLLLGRRVCKVRDVRACGSHCV